ncbi:MAG: DUF1592 domain-containing protein [Pirellulaceae bacterium]
MLHANYESRPMAALGVLWFGLGIAGAGMIGPVLGADSDGERIYRAQCARCHGEHGEGTSDAYAQPLAGDRGLQELAAYIAKTMPEDTDEKCTGADAEKVAAFIYESFYSRAAQIRNQPARLELSRLTIRQYQQTLADLIGSFRTGTAPRSQEHGLRGEYYKSRRFRRGDRVLERVDSEIQFDFRDGSPAPGKLEPREFSIRWQGSLYAPDTGDYEFLIRTDHAARFWLNDLNDGRPLIDAWVKSGDDNEYRAGLRLIGGRYYPIKLEFSKANQGVEKKDDKKPIAPAFLELRWKLPRQTAEAIPGRYLVPEVGPETLVVSTPFPPDDRSVGYERGTSVSREWDAATTDAALEVAAYVAARLDALSGVQAADTDRPTLLRTFAELLAARAFRRPLSDVERERYIHRQFTDAADADSAVKRVVLLVLKSPHFLYREIDPSDPYDVASRLSYALWDSLPDEALLSAAAQGELATPKQIRAQAERMMGDYRTRAKVRQFLLHWLNIDQLPDVSKDPESFPGFDAAIVTDLRTSLDLFLDEVVWNDSSDFRQLLRADHVYMNGRLAQFYGADLDPSAPFQKVFLQRDHRAGVLSHPYLMAGLAYSASSSPIHRGVFLSRSILGRVLRPPPEAVAPLPAELHAELTTRERVTLQTRPEACQSCHGMINPLGFTLERFDAVGRYRDQERGRPVDTRGEYLTQDGRLVKFSGVKDLAEFVAASSESHAAFVEQMFHYMIKQPIRAYGLESMRRLQADFVRNDFHIQRQLIDIVSLAAFPPQSPQKESTP